MTRRELYRLKKRLKAHLKRAGVVLALLLAVVLMICGCLYIFEHIGGNDKKVEADQKAGNDETNEGSELNNEEPAPSDQPLDTDGQLLQTYNYQYSKPDASGLHICLDAGHGGNDAGTQSGNFIVKDVNFAITKKVEALLKEAGATVSLVRKADEYIDLADRTYISNQSGASFLLSLHCNYYEGDTSINGLEIYYHRNSETSKQYAESMTDFLRAANAIHVRDAVKQNMQVLRNSAIPAVMIEMGFLSNPEECANLNDPLYQEYLARLLVESLVAVLKPATGA